jgi:hypothetical protein
MGENAALADTSMVNCCTLLSEYAQCTTAFSGLRLSTTMFDGEEIAIFSSGPIFFLQELNKSIRSVEILSKLENFNFIILVLRAAAHL